MRLGPHVILRLLDVHERRERPVGQLLGGHVGRHPGQLRVLVAGVPLREEDPRRSHVVGEADPAGERPRIVDVRARQHRSRVVGVAVALEEPLEEVADRPRVGAQLEERVVDEEIARVVAGVLTLEHHPQRAVADRQQPGVAEIAAEPVDQQEALVARQRRVVDHPVLGRPVTREAVVVAQRVPGDGVEVGEELRVPVRGLDPGPLRHRAAVVEGEPDPEGHLPARGDLEAQQPDAPLAAAGGRRERTREV